MRLPYDNEMQTFRTTNCSSEPPLKHCPRLKCYTEISFTSFSPRPFPFIGRSKRESRLTREQYSAPLVNYPVYVDCSESLVNLSITCCQSWTSRQAINPLPCTLLLTTYMFNVLLEFSKVHFLLELTSTEVESRFRKLKETINRSSFALVILRWPCPSVVATSQLKSNKISINAQAWKSCKVCNLTLSTNITTLAVFTGDQRHFESHKCTKT